MFLSRPALRGERLWFLSEDDVWTAPLAGGRAERLTRGINRVAGLCVSRDGARLALAAREEGAPDVYRMASTGGPLERLTWLGVGLEVIDFTPDDLQVRFAASRGGPRDKEHQLWRVASEGGLAEHVRLGPVRGFAELGPRRALCRWHSDLSPWKRYRGGRAGRIWVDEGEGWQELPALGGNLASPFWLEERLGFVSDHEGSANLYTCAPDGTDLQPLTQHDDFAVRHPRADGETVVYGKGGSLWSVRAGSEPVEIPVELPSQRTRLQPQYPSASHYLQGVDPHPDGHTLAVVARGRPFVGAHWEGPMIQLGERQGVRYQHATWLDADRLIWVSDASGEEQLEVHHVQERRTESVEVDLPGRPIAIYPHGDRVAIVTHDNHLVIVDLEQGSSMLLSRGPRYLPHGVSWSHDGRWLAWSEPQSQNTAKIRLADLEALTEDGPPIVDVTDGRYQDVRPDFDPLGRYLFFISFREFAPVRDQNVMGYGFPRGARPYLVPLKRGTPSLFDPRPRGFAKPKAPKPPERVQIDLPGIADRVMRMPLPEANYKRVWGLPSGRLLLVRAGVTPARKTRPGQVVIGSDALVLYDVDRSESNVVHTKLNSVHLDASRSVAVLRSGRKVRVIPADADKATRAELKKDLPYRTTRKTFWIDLNRIRLEVDVQAEWMQMADEAWRLMRDHFWDPQMAGVDWEAVREHYRPLFERAGSRSELSTLLWAMMGECATSHAYEIGGAYPASLVRTVGRLAADVTWDGEAWKVERVHRGDRGHPRRSSPLLWAGAVEGSRIHAVNGEPVTGERPIEASLAGHAGRPVELDLTLPDGERFQSWFTTLTSDEPARYRSWVEDNRVKVHQATDGRVGYVHAPDMSPAGYADFFRDYLAECKRGGLIVDVRFNGGGHVSQLLLAKLMQRRLAYVQSRHFGVHEYPADSVLGPMVALTNENAGSDGDIFSHNWKQLGLGPLIGTRTWGGVVGISPRHALVDGTIMTQPEFAFWFEGGVGWGVEGHGVDPDIEVRHSPEDYLAGRDPQLDVAIATIIESLADMAIPTFEAPPKR